jgi:hypothetical protein
MAAPVQILLNSSFIYHTIRLHMVCSKETIVKEPTKSERTVDEFPNTHEYQNRKKYA